MKAKIEHEQAEQVKNEEQEEFEKLNEMMVSEFLYEFLEKYGSKKWVDSTYTGNNGLLENYVHPYLGKNSVPYGPRR